MSYQKHNFEPKQTLTASALNEIEDGIVALESAPAVRYTPQELTTEEQAQARANTGAVSAEEVVAIVDAKISSITNAEEVAY
jgi:hypothetical protein